MLIWTFGVLRCLKRGSPHKRFAALAVLVQSLWDYSLSIPGNLWLFSYCAASTVPESSRAVNVPSRWKLPACLLVLGVAGVACRFLWLRWGRRAPARERRRGGPRGRLRPSGSWPCSNVLRQVSSIPRRPGWPPRWSCAWPKATRGRSAGCCRRPSIFRARSGWILTARRRGGRWRACMFQPRPATSPESLAWPARPPALGCDCHERALVGPSGVNPSPRLWRP